MPQEFSDSISETIARSVLDSAFNTDADPKALFSLGFEKFSTKTHVINVDKGFFTPGEAPNIDQQLLLIVGEISEAHDAYRNNNANDDKLPDRLGLEVELADAVIRIMNLGRQAGLDIAGAIIEKTEFNALRPHKHGKSF